MSADQWQTAREGYALRPDGLVKRVPESRVIAFQQTYDEEQVRLDRHLREHLDRELNARLADALIHLLGWGESLLLTTEKKDRPDPSGFWGRRLRHVIGRVTATSCPGGTQKHILRLEAQTRQLRQCLDKFLAAIEEAGDGACEETQTRLAFLRGLLEPPTTKGNESVAPDHVVRGNP